MKIFEVRVKTVHTFVIFLVKTVFLSSVKNSYIFNVTNIYAVSIFKIPIPLECYTKKELLK